MVSRRVSPGSEPDPVEPVLPPPATVSATIRRMPASKIVPSEVMALEVDVVRDGGRMSRGRGIARCHGGWTGSGSGSLFVLRYVVLSQKSVYAAVEMEPVIREELDL